MSAARSPGFLSVEGCADTLSCLGCLFMLCALGAGFLIAWSLT